MHYTQMFIIALFMVNKNTQMSISGWVSEQNALYSYSEILLSHEKERSTDTWYSVDECWAYYAKWRRTNTKRHMLYDSIYMKYPEEINLQRQKANRWLPEADGRGNRGWLINVYEVLFWGNEDVLELDTGGGYTTL